MRHESNPLSPQSSKGEIKANRMSSTKTERVRWEAVEFDLRRRVCGTQGETPACRAETSVLLGI